MQIPADTPQIPADTGTSDPTKIAEGFNNYFSTIAEKLVPKTTPGSKHFSMYLNNPLDNTLQRF